MRKTTLVLLVLLMAAISIAAAKKPYPFAFIGRWQSSENPLLVDENGFQDIQNLRKDGKRFKGVAGDTAVNSTKLYNPSFTGSDWIEVDANDTMSITPSVVAVGDITSDEFAYLYNDIGYGISYKKSFSQRSSQVVYSGLHNNTNIGPTVPSGCDSVYLAVVTDTGSGYVGSPGTDNDFYGVRLFTYSYLDYVRIEGPTSQSNPVRFGSGAAFILDYDASTRVFTLNIYSDSSFSTITATTTLDASADDFSYNIYIPLSIFNDKVSNITILTAASKPWLPVDTGFQLRSYETTKSYNLIHIGGEIYQNITSIPDAGNFNDSPIYTDGAGSTTASFTSAPQNNVVYTNGAETLIWSGDEMPVNYFVVAEDFTSPSTPVNPKDYTDQVNNKLFDVNNVAPIGGSTNDSSVVLMLHFNGADGATSTVDSSLVGHTPLGFVASAALDDSQRKFGTTSLYDPSSTSELTVPDNDSFTFGTRPFTIDFWARSAGNAGADQYLFWHGDATNNIFMRTSIGYGTVHFFQSSSTAANAFSLQGATTLNRNQWYHFAVIRGWGGDNDTIALTVDGTAIATKKITGVTLEDHTGNFIVGGALASNNLIGWIDEFRIQKPKAGWTSKFNPPATESTDDFYRDFLVGVSRPIQGLKMYINDTDSNAGTLTGYEWNGSSWTDMNINDSTAGLSTTGTITWNSLEAKKQYIQGLVLYWYRFELTSGTSSVYHVTANAPMEPITNIWDGVGRVLFGSRLYDGTKFYDYTDEMRDGVYLTGADLSGLTTSGYLELGFTERMTGFQFSMMAGNESTANSVATVYYWNGYAWTAASSLSDTTTNVSGKSLSGSGAMYFQDPGTTTVFPTSLIGEEPLYWYKIAWNATLGNDTVIAELNGIAATDPMRGYEFAASYKNRLFLFDENQALYSSFNTPYIFNGLDSGNVYFGNQDKVVAAATIYNLFRTNGIEQLIVAKEHEMYRMYGSSPDTWEVQQMTPNVGCSAPKSMAVCEVSDLTEGEPRHVAVWQSSSGVYMTDGSVVMEISKDIDNYWDPSKDEYIEPGNLNQSYGWCDPNLKVYKLLIASGNDTSTLNTELEYSFRYKEWTKIVRPDPLQSGWQVKAENGASYTYGGGLIGTVYRLENGTTFHGTAISQMLHTKDLLLGDELPLFNRTLVEHMLLYSEDRTANDSLSITHYCDGILTTNDSNQQYLPNPILLSEGTRVIRHFSLGPCAYHSFKFQVSTSTESDGWEPLGMGLYYTPYDTLEK